MNKKWLHCFIIIPFTITLLWGAPGTDKNNPPETSRKPVADTLHGVEIVDPYRWLEDQDSPETRDWIQEQNKYTESLLGDFPGRDKLRTRLTELLKVDDIGVPKQRNGRYFYTKRTAEQDLEVIYLKQDGKEEVLIDPHTMSDDLRTSVNIQAVSDDGSLLIYGVRRGGEDEIKLRLLDVDTRTDLADQLPKARYFGISITPDNRGLYYTLHGAEGSRVYFHRIGTEPQSDKMIFGEGYDPGKIIFSDLSGDGQFLLIHVLHGSAGKTEIYVKDLTADAPVRTVAKEIDARTFGEIAGGSIYLETDWQASNKRIMAVDLTRPDLSPQNWREVIPEGTAVIEGSELIGGKILVEYLENVVSKLKLFETDGTLVREIDFPVMGSVSDLSGTWDSDAVFFAYSSFHIPKTIYQYNVGTGSREVWAKQDVPVSSDNIEVKQVWYDSKDGTRIPMFLVHRKGIELDGTNPTYLTGYGGFTVSRTPRFSARAALWVELGGVYALPNLRGGGEFGEAWHRAGMLENKQNVFDDFIAAAEYLIDEGYTNSSKLAIAGGSNGGLLVGAAFTQRPALFEAVICSVPLLDMIRYHQFLVARFWTPEYGSSENPEQFDYLLDYSPYHNVEKGTEYPAILFITGDADTRVAPLHARKMTALMQWATGSDAPILLYYDTKSGHSGGKPVSQKIADMTVSFSFLLQQLDESVGQN